MPSGSGRKGAPEWMEVTKMSSDKGKVTCDHCGREVSAKIERIKAHLSKCPKKSVQCISDCTLMNDDLESIPSTSGQQSSLDKNNSLMNITKRQKTMTGYTVRTTESEKFNLDLKVAKFFYANNIAFNAAASEEYAKMFKALRPGYSGPSRLDLGGKLLDTVCTEVDDLINKQMQEKGTNCATLLLDGWSNVRNDAIIATCVHTGSNSFFLNAIDSGSHEKNADYCAKVAKEAIEHCKEKFGIKIFGICTDNENKMVRMRQILSDENKDLVTYGCSAHYINLLAEEISNKNILKHVVEVQKFFRNHHQPHGLLKEKGGLSPQLPSETRWNSQIACIETFSKNYHKYVEIQTEYPNIFPSNIGKILENVLIYKEVLHMQKQLADVEKILDCMQAENTDISDAVELWLNLKESENLTPYEENIQKRIKNALLPCHYLANLMNPKYEGKRLTSYQEQLAEDWLETKHPEWLVHVMAFKLRDSKFFPKSMFNSEVIKNFSAAQWWNLMERRSEDSVSKNFYQFMASLCSCPASSASVERIFSTCGLVWSKLRNKLGLETAQKLVKVNRFLKQKENNEK